MSDDEVMDDEIVADPPPSRDGNDNGTVVPLVSPPCQYAISPHHLWCFRERDKHRYPGRRFLWRDQGRWGSSSKQQSRARMLSCKLQLSEGGWWN
jgi:hypothetical protein